ELYGIGLDEKFADRDAWKARQPLSPSERARQERALQEAIADPAKDYDIELSFEPRPGEVRWLRSRGKVFRDENARPLRVTGATTDITAQKLAQEALRQSEERYERVVLAADAGVWDWDVASDKFYVSPKLLEIAGFAPGATFSGREDFMRRAPFHPEDRDKYRQEVKQLFASGGSHLTTEVRSVLDGETVWNRLDGICFRDPAGRVVRWTGSVTDITERKRAEEALRESEQRYARVMQASEDGFWEWIVASDQFYASPRMLAIYGLPPNTVFRGRADFLARFPFHPKDLPLWRASVAAHLAGVTARIDIEIRGKVRDEMRWLHLTGICQRDASGAEERWTGSVSDITERRQAQEALRRSEERYARAMEGSDAGHWDWNIVSDEMFVSERARDMLALPAGALPARRSQIMDLVPMHPQDRAAMAEAVKTGIRSGVHERDYRVIPRPGEVRWLRTRAKVYKDAHGAAVRMTGSIIDITERKLAAEALRLSEQRYARAMDAAEAGHWEWNVATDEMFVSARQREMLELPARLHFANREAYLSAIPFHPEDREQFVALARRHIDEAWPRFEQEFRVIVKGGETRWMRLAGKSHFGADGKPTHFTGSLADITDQQRAEDLLAAEKQLLEMMAHAKPLSEVLDALCRTVEENLSGCLCGISLVDATGTRLGNGAAPSLPRAYLEAIED
ncbi:MAG TPA: PAS domain-containing protein, partial [Burkholderiales bacterium]|nr:PAS domain-containing protein [Burkholderiales bacterium]